MCRKQIIHFVGGGVNQRGGGGTQCGGRGMEKMATVQRGVIKFFFGGLVAKKKPSNHRE